jgi:hypothetical protein
MSRPWQQKVTIFLFALLAIAYGVRRYINSRETLRTITEPMRVAVTNDVVYFHGDSGRYFETNAEWAKGLREAKSKMALVTINEIWVKGHRRKWRIEGFQFADTNPTPGN